MPKITSATPAKERPRFRTGTRGRAVAEAVKVTLNPPTEGRRLTPTEILGLMESDPRRRPFGRTTYDTETSGLHTDDGARAAVASIAWEDPDRAWEADGAAGAISWAEEEIAPGRVAFIASIAWPFDQGADAWQETDPKPEFKGNLELNLFPEDTNLDEREFAVLVGDLLPAMAHWGDGLAAHPMKFDCMIIRAGLRHAPYTGFDLEPHTSWDTQNVCDLLWPLELKGLKATHDRLWPGSNYGDAAKAVKDFLRKAKLPSGRWDLVPWQIIGPYADMDARMTKKIELRQAWEIVFGGGASWIGTPEEVTAAVGRRMETSRWLYRMERRGMPYDEQLSRLTGEQALKVRDKLAERLPFYPKEAKRFFFEPDFVSKRGEEGLGLIPYQMTEPSKAHPQGQPSMTAEVLGRMVEDGVAHAEKYAQWAQVDTAISMWYFGYADKTAGDGRLRTVFRQNGTRSTRFSVERCNLQAIPHDYRMSKLFKEAGVLSPRQIIAEAVRLHCPGWRLWELDLQQAELRVGAMMAECNPMLEMMERGDDLHAYTTQELFNIGPDDPKWGQMRQVGKRGNFSLGFGSGAKTFMNMISKETGLRLTLPATQRIVWDWNGLYPEWKRAIDRHMRKVDRRMSKYGHGWVQFGNRERRWFQPYEDSHKAFNQRVQGSIAQFGIDWGLEVEAMLRDNGLGDEDVPGIGGVGSIIPIHDSQNLLVPDTEDGEALVREAQRIGVALWPKHFSGVSGGVDIKSW